MKYYRLKVMFGDRFFEIQIGKSGYYWRVYMLTSIDGYIYYDDDDYEFFEDEKLSVSEFDTFIIRIKRLIEK